MQLNVAVEKINKYATRESGDTVEIIERPGGGISVVLADGQSSGRGAKKISNMVVRKVISLLAEGVRDGAAARAASDFLFSERGGKVSATLNIFSADLHSNTLVITRNNPAPTLIYNNGQLEIIDAPSLPIGIYRHTRPQILEVPLEINLTACMYTDGLVHAGTRMGTPMNTPLLFTELANKVAYTSTEIADHLLRHALELDQNRPADDISVVVIRVNSLDSHELIRRLSIQLPIQG